MQFIIYRRLWHLLSYALGALSKPPLPVSDMKFDIFKKYFCLNSILQNFILWQASLGRGLRTGPTALHRLRGHSAGSGTSWLITSTSSETRTRNEQNPHQDLASSLQELNNLFLIFAPLTIIPCSTIKEQLRYSCWLQFKTIKDTKQCLCRLLF